MNLVVNKPPVEGTPSRYEIAYGYFYLSGDKMCRANPLMFNTYEFAKQRFDHCGKEWFENPDEIFISAFSHCVQTGREAIDGTLIVHMSYTELNQYLRALSKVLDKTDYADPLNKLFDEFHFLANHTGRAQSE